MVIISLHLHLPPIPWGRPPSCCQPRRSPCSEAEALTQQWEWSNDLEPLRKHSKCIVTLLALLEVGGVGSAFFLGESTQIGFKFIVCVVIINKNKRYPLLLRELLWLKRSSGVGCLYCYSVFTETRRAVFQEAAPGPGLWAPLPSLPAYHPPTSSRSADGDQASFSAITADPPHSLPPNVWLRCSSFLFTSPQLKQRSPLESKAALPNRQQQIDI